MSCGGTEDLNTLVDKLTNLMTDTFRSCISNYKSLLPYLGRKVTNSEIRHKLVRVNILLNKLNEELLALRVEYVTVSSNEQKMDTVLPEGGRKRTASNVLIIDRCVTKNRKMKAPFSSNIKCSVSLNSEAGTNKQAENLVLNNTEEKIPSQPQILDILNMKNIKKEIEDSNEAENIRGVSISNSQIPLAHNSCVTTNNEMTVRLACDEVGGSVADRLAGSNAYDKSAVPIMCGENNEVCVPLQSVESQSVNQEKCEVTVKNIKKEIEDSSEAEGVHELPINNNNKSPVAQKSCETKNNEMTVSLAGDEVCGSVTDRLADSNAYNKSAVPISQRENNNMCGPVQSGRCDTSSKVKSEDGGNVLSKDQGIYKELNGDSTSSFSYQAKTPFNSKETSVTFTASENESAVLVGERANSCNRGERRSLHSPIKYKKDCVPARNRTEEDILYGIIKIKNGLFRCTLCNRKLYCETTVSCHIRGKQHKKARIGLTVKKNGCTKEPEDLPYGIIKAKNGMYRCTLCSRKLVCDTAMHGHVRGNQHKTALTTVKNNSCTKETQVPNNRYKIEFVNYPAVKGHVKQKQHKMKQDAAKNSCSKVLEFSSNNNKSTAQDSICSAVACPRADTVPDNSCDNTVSISLCSAVPCSLADNVAIVEDTYQVMSMKPAVVLNDIWTHFYAPFHINKKFFRFNSGQIICFLCYEQVGRYIMNVRAHISGSSHLDRVNTLRNIELKNKSSNKQLLDIPGSLNNVVPAAQFSLCNSGFFCNVCNCYLENTVVLSHMTAKSHGEKVDEMEKENSMELTV